VQVFNFAHLPKGWRELPCVAFHGLELPYVFGNIPHGSFVAQSMGRASPTVAMAVLQGR
jgi:hypothetical protein